MSVSGWIGVDLDATLAHYDGWDGGKIGAPIPAMVARVKAWLAEGVTVKIFTARVGRTGQVSDVGTDDHLWALEQEQLITAWCLEHIGAALPITATKDFAMIELWDDRCIQVIPNTGEALASLGATGEYPQGKVRDDDRGALKFAIGTLNDTVHIQFGAPCEWIGLDKETALSLAATIVKHAEKL